MDLQAYLKDLEYLVNIDSCSDDPEGLNRMADFFTQRFWELGWNLHTYDLAPDSGTLLVCTNREAETYDVMLMGHLDTVFPKGTCARRPFRMEGNKAFGPGVGDMKQGCLLMYYLMKALPPSIHEKLNIAVVFNPDEEIGSRYSRSFYIPYAQKAKRAFLYEARGIGGNYCASRKGSVQAEVRLTGRAGHCGFVFTNGAISAVSEMARWIVALDTLQSKERDTTVNVGVASGGTKANVVAEFAEFTVDARFSDPAEEDRIRTEIQTLTAQAESRGYGVSASFRGKKAWAISAEAAAYLEHVREIAEQAGMPAEFKYRGGLSDANIVSQYGPVCIDGLGPSGSDGHNDSEYILIDSIPETFDFSMLLLKDLAENPG